MPVALRVPFAISHLPPSPAVWDLGGQTGIRPYWRYYYPNTHAIIYVVDSTDVERLPTTRDEFHQILGEKCLHPTTPIQLGRLAVQDSACS